MDKLIKAFTLAGKIGADNAARALTKMTGQNTKVETVSLEVKRFEDFVDKSEFSPVPFLIFDQTVRGDDAGFALLVIKEPEGRKLAKLLSGEPAGLPALQERLGTQETQGLAETLNILSNSYINAISRNVKNKLIILDPPEIIYGRQLFDVIKDMAAKEGVKGKKIIVFETLLVIENHSVRARLVLVFEEKLLERVA